MADLTTLNTSNFDEIVNGADKPILVDFWAEWCQPCRQISPILEELSSERADFTVAKLNIDESPDIASRFEVMSIPTMILFEDGQPQARIVGAMGKSQLLDQLSPHLV